MRKWILVLAMVMLGGCASMKGSSETFNITSNEPNTIFYLGTHEIGRGSSATVSIQKSALIGSVFMVTKEGCEPRSVEVKSELDAATLQNIFIPYGGIGFLIDATSGAIRKASQTWYTLSPYCSPK